MIGRGSSNKAKASSRGISSKRRDVVAKSVVERLEERRMLTITVSGGVLEISRTGTSQNLQIIVGVDPTDSTQYQVYNNGAIRDFPMAGINTTNIELGSGNNLIEVDATFPETGGQENGLTGGSGNDTILGSPGADVINGGLGANSLAGRGGNDNVSAGDNGLTDPASNDTITGGAGDDILLGGNGNDIIHAGMGDDQVSGGAGADTLVGGAGNDSMFGKSGADLLMGGAGNNALFGGKGPDTLFGGAGDNTLTGGKGLDVLAGNNEDNLSLTGADAVPGTGADSISGGPGADTILASSGLDTVFGGAGPNDFNTVAGDVLTDFTPSQGDYQPSQQVFNGTAVEDITITLNINVLGNAVPIPSDAGSFAGGTSIAEVTGVSGDTATIQFRDVTSRTFVLGDFFNQFGISLRPTGLGQFVDNNGGTLTMTVNGNNNVNFDAYAVQNGDSITLSYE